jgi:hypothetical protein
MLWLRSCSAAAEQSEGMLHMQGIPWKHVLPTAVAAALCLHFKLPQLRHALLFNVL